MFQVKCTAIHSASTFGEKNIVKLLCNSGADLNLQCDFVSLMYCKPFLFNVSLNVHTLTIRIYSVV